MRIISGGLKGRKIPNVYNIKNVSPSSDFLKGVLFNVIGAGIEGSVFYDLYAGTGNVGFEAVSRGAAFCVFVETSPELTSIIIKLSKQFKIEEKVKIIKKDVLKALDKEFLKEYKPDYIFLDPPYDSGFCEKTINGIITNADFRNISGTGNIIVQHDKNEILSDKYPPYELIKEKKHGKSVLSFYGAL
ncbi:MAG: 16S rRNA (guanine(966)-N(2))-methyltransferase RsmD [bacterium]